MSDPIDRTIFDSPLHVVPLGHLDPVEDEWIVTLNDLPDRLRNGYRLVADDAGLLNSIDVRETHRPFTPQEQVQLLEMADQNIVALLAADVNVFAINLVPALRHRLDFLAESGTEYQLRVDNGNEFAIPILGVGFFRLMDGLRSLGDIAASVYDSMIQSAEGKAALAEIDGEEESTFDEYVRTVAFEVLQALRVAGAGSVESAPSISAAS